MTELSDSDRAAILEALGVAADPNPAKHAKIFLAGKRAGMAAQKEKDARICEAQTALGPVWREMFAAAIRSQPDR